MITIEAVSIWRLYEDDRKDYYQNNYCSVRFSTGHAIFLSQVKYISRVKRDYAVRGGNGK